MVSNTAAGTTTTAAATVRSTVGRFETCWLILPRNGTTLSETAIRSGYPATSVSFSPVDSIAVISIVRIVFITVVFNPLPFGGWGDRSVAR
jgi:hypothetical protein